MVEVGVAVIAGTGGKKRKEPAQVAGGGGHAGFPEIPLHQQHIEGRAVVGDVNLGPIDQLAAPLHQHLHPQAAQAELGGPLQQASGRLAGPNREGQHLEVVGGEAPGEGEHPLEKLNPARTGSDGMDS